MSAPTVNVSVLLFQVPVTSVPSSTPANFPSFTPVTTRSPLVPSMFAAHVPAGRSAARTDTASATSMSGASTARVMANTS